MTLGKKKRRMYDKLLNGTRGEGDMKDRPRRKRNFPKGFPVETDLEAMQKARLVQAADDLCEGCLLANWSNQYGRPVKPVPHMIRRAYTEPLGFNIVENILLQRDYIID